MKNNISNEVVKNGKSTISSMRMKEFNKKNLRENIDVKNALDFIIKNYIYDSDEKDKLNRIFRFKQETADVIVSIDIEFKDNE